MGRRAARLPRRARLAAQYGPQVGRVACQVGMLRGAISAFQWAENCEWIFVDPALIDDMAWEMAVARSGGKKVAVELDGPHAYYNHRLHPQFTALYAEHTRQCYAHSADYVSHANWSQQQDYRRGVDDGMYACAADAKQEAFSVPVADDAVFLGKWDSYLRKYLGWAKQPGEVLEATKARFQTLRRDRQAVDIVMDDTIQQYPKRLSSYARIHLPGARFIARPTWEALQQSGTNLICNEGSHALRDETGVKLTE